MTEFNEPGIFTKEQIDSTKDIDKNPCKEINVNLGLVSMMYWTLTSEGDRVVQERIRKVLEDD